MRTAAALLLLSAASAPCLARVFTLDILHTNDVHGGIVSRDATFLNPDFPPEIGGAAWLASYVDSVRREAAGTGGYVLLLDAGDIYQGTPVGGYDLGASVVRWMNFVGYDAMTLGNHDFDDGAANALAIAAAADFPVLSCNFVEEATGLPPCGIEPMTFFEFEGVKIALIGLSTSDTWGLVDPALLEGYSFLDEEESVGAAMEEARRSGADIVFVLSHLGQPSDPGRYVESVRQAWISGEEFDKEFALNNAELSSLLPGIALIVSGHIHYGLARPWVNPFTGTIVVQGYANGTGVGHIRLLIDSEARTVTGYELPRGEEIVNLLHDEFQPDPEALALIESFRTVAEAGMDEVIGEALEEIPRGGAEHPMGRLVADAVLECTGADVALVNRGGIRSSIPRGLITPRMIYEAIPFEEDLYLVEVTGAQLRRILETGMQGRRRDMEPAGFTAVRNQALPDMAKIESLIVGGEPVDSSRAYVLATTGYLVQGNVGYDVMREFEAVPAGCTLFDAVVAYVKAHSPLEPDEVPRIRWTE
ncbi:bifunctional metallophosphatase/5'-nucleotidase [Candidatus Fermentibacteria bacterium]|nr:bifunctional metallophosphatase/5'-nucleotidase [Candidatus Fermentibacteria bacterium]